MLAVWPVLLVIRTFLIRTTFLAVSSHSLAPIGWSLLKSRINPSETIA